MGRRGPRGKSWRGEKMSGHFDFEVFLIAPLKPYAASSMH